jgi:hypothetical protein
MGGDGNVTKRSFLIYGAGGCLLQGAKQYGYGRQEFIYMSDGYVCRIYDGIKVCIEQSNKDTS